MVGDTIPNRARAGLSVSRTVATAGSSPTSCDRRRHTEGYELTSRKDHRARRIGEGGKIANGALESTAATAAAARSVRLTPRFNGR